MLRIYELLEVRYTKMYAVGFEHFRPFLQVARALPDLCASWLSVEIFMALECNLTIVCRHSNIYST